MRSSPLAWAVSSAVNPAPPFRQRRSRNGRWATAGVRCASHMAPPATRPDVPSAFLGKGGDVNRLSGATSPYLLQHADNPVGWWPWTSEAFEEARRRDVPGSSRWGVVEAQPLAGSISHSLCPEAGDWYGEDPFGKSEAWRLRILTFGFLDVRGWLREPSRRCDLAISAPACRKPSGLVAVVR